MTQGQARSAGSLQVGKVMLHDNGIFVADMMFTAAPGYPVSDIDTVKSALMAVQRTLLMLLHRNGIWRYDAPAVEHKIVSKDGILFSVGIQTYAGAPTPIMVNTRDRDDG